MFVNFDKCAIEWLAKSTKRLVKRSGEMGEINR